MQKSSKGEKQRLIYKTILPARMTVETTRSGNSVSPVDQLGKARVASFLDETQMSVRLTTRYEVPQASATI